MDRTIHRYRDVLIPKSRLDNGLTVKGQIMLKTMLARYSGICAVSGVRFPIGSDITYCTVTRKAFLVEKGDCQIDTIPSTKRYISDVYRFDGGKEVYRNKNGLCIDAPCCGCCTG